MKDKLMEEVMLRDATLEQLFDEIESRDGIVTFDIYEQVADASKADDKYVSLEELVGNRAIIYVPGKDLTISTRNRIGC